MCEGGAQFDYKKGGMVFIGTIPLWFLLELWGMDFNWNYFMENKLELFNKEYADRFIRENYERLAEKICVSVDRLTGDRKKDGYDMFHDNILSLYESDIVFNDYCSFKKWAMKKFTERDKRNG